MGEVDVQLVARALAAGNKWRLIQQLRSGMFARAVGVSDPGGSQPVARVPIASADMLALDPSDSTTFPVLVASTGADKLLVPIAGTWQYIPNTTGYTGTPGTKIGVGFVSNPGVSEVPLQILTDGANPGNYFETNINVANYPNPVIASFLPDPDALPGGAVPLRVQGQDLVLMLDNAISGGDGDFVVTVQYLEVTLTP